MKANNLAETVLKNLYRCGLTAREYAVFLAWFEDANGYNASQDTIAERTGIDRPDVCKILKRLINKGVLQFVKKGQRGINYYVLATKMTLPPGAKVDEVIYGTVTQPVVVEPTRHVVAEPHIKVSGVVVEPRVHVAAEPHIPQNNHIIENSSPSESENTDISVPTIVFGKIYEACSKNKPTYIPHLMDTIRSLVATYGNQVTDGDVQSAARRAFKDPDSKRRAADIASAELASALSELVKLKVAKPAVSEKAVTDEDPYDDMSSGQIDAQINRLKKKFGFREA
jgi:predicted regulator of amino acid metabolism with ACT domain